MIGSTIFFGLITDDQRARHIAAPIFSAEHTQTLTHETETETETTHRFSIKVKLCIAFEYKIQMCLRVFFFFVVLRCLSVLT